MTDPTPEKPDAGAVAKAAKRALDGTDVGSDTRAGSLQGGASTGSENDEAQAASDQHLAEMGSDLRKTGRPPAPR